MDSALAWIGQVADWIGQWIPRWVILDPTSGAVKYVGGSKSVVLGAGIHFYWPARTVVARYSVARKIETLPTQTMVTTDDRSVAVGGIIVYQVVDLLKLLPRVDRPQHAIKDMSMTAVHDVICRMDWSTLKTEQSRGTLDTKLRHAARKNLEEYGVEVIKVQLTDMVPIRALRLFQWAKEDEDK